MRGTIIIESTSKKSTFLWRALWRAKPKPASVLDITVSSVDGIAMAKEFEMSFETR